MKVENLNGDYCDRCAHTLGNTRILRYMVIPMCESCIDVWFQVKDWQIMNAFFKKHDDSALKTRDEKHPGT